MRFGSKIALVIRNDLAGWQKLNVAAFLTSGVLADNPGIIGQAYEDAEGRIYSALIGRPIIVLSASGEVMRQIFERATSRNVRLSLYIEDMFATRCDEENRAAVKRHVPNHMSIVGLGMCHDRAVVDRITKGARMHD